MNKDFFEKNYKILAFLFLLVFAIIATASIMHKSVTYDEIVYVAAGYNLVKNGDYRLNTEHPPLAKILAGLPLLIVQPNIPEYNADEWQFAHDFFFSSGNDADKILFFSRIPFIIIGIITGIFLFLFAKELFGTKAGLLSLFMFSFSPDIIAQSQIATTDMIVTTFLFISVYILYYYLKTKKIILIAFFGITYGLALSSKFTSVYLLPAYFIIIALFEIQKSKKPFLQAIKKKAVLGSIFEDTKYIALGFLLAVFILFLSYMFQFSYYLEGISSVFRSSGTGRFSYLLGRHYVGGNLLYYPVGFLIKTPIVFLVFLLMALILINRVTTPGKNIFLLVPVIIFLIPSLINSINLGVRHILVIYPFLFVYAGSIVNLNIKSAYIKAGFFALLTWYILAALFIFPNYISYFNELIGGPDNGAKYMLDSNIDWGQDSRMLAEYIKQNGITDVSISYFGNDDISYRGINYTSLGCTQVKGIVAISVNNLFGISSSQAACSEWLLEFAPYKKMGYTIWLYNITRDFTEQEIQVHLYKFNQALQKDLDLINAPQIELCKKSCITGCASQGRIYINSQLSGDTCTCTCSQY